MSMRLLIPLLLPLALAATALPAAASEPDRKLLDALLPDGHATPAPGCALAMFEQGRMSRLLVEGYADLDARRLIDADSVFYAASLSKQFTALAVIQLALQGKIDLDDEIQAHLPELPRYRAPATIRMLLHHAAGIRDSLSLLRLAGWQHMSEPDMEDALSLLYMQRDTNFVPGTATSYSNGGYLLLADIVQRASGKSFAQYVRDSILAPLGMHDSYVLDGAAPDGPRVARGHVRTGDGFAVRDTYPRFGGSGGLMVTMADLARYEYDIEQGHKVWTPGVLAAMTAPGQLTDGSPASRTDTDFVYASGLMLGSHAGHPIVRHGGAAEGFRNLYVRIPGQSRAVAVLCNRSDAKPQDVMDHVFEAAPAPLPREGHYRSDELPSDYAIHHSDGMPMLTILRAGHDATVHALSPSTGGDGSFRAGSMVLRPFDTDALVLETERARGIVLRLKRGADN